MCAIDFVVIFQPAGVFTVLTFVPTCCTDYSCRLTLHLQLQAVDYTLTQSTVCPTVDHDGGPKLKSVFRYPVSQLSRDCHEIL